jgi:hypothetical protein
VLHADNKTLKITRVALRRCRWQMAAHFAIKLRSR